MEKRSFDFGQTVEASLFVPKRYFRDLMRAAMWPAAAFVPAFALYLYVALDVTASAGQLQQGVQIGFWEFLGPTMMAMVPMILVAAALMYNWQRFLMIGGDQQPMDDGEAPVSAPPVEHDWWAGYRLYLLRSIQLGVIFLVPYLFFMDWMFTSIDPGKIQAGNGTIEMDASDAFLPFWLFFGLMIMVYPYLMRAMLVFPAVAAGIPDATFRNVFSISRGLGWKMVGTYIATIFTMMILMFAVMIVFAIVVAIGAAIAQAIGPWLSVLALPFMILLYAAFYLYMLGYYGAFGAMVLMQLLPDYHDRWEELSGRGPTVGPSAGGGDDGPATYGQRKG